MKLTKQYKKDALLYSKKKDGVVWTINFTDDYIAHRTLMSIVKDEYRRTKIRLEALYMDGELLYELGDTKIEIDDFYYILSDD
jgi:hypothetical protein|tara:strand:- start:935 stop:1183 length:249 start_codon:yes stop_codon:yes gene_type:complete